MYRFLSNNYAELIARCKAKVSQRPRRAATPEQLANGIPLFLSQLINTLEAEDEGRMAESLRLSGASGGGDSTKLSVMGASATAHGKELLELGYSVDQVVHDYGDICQAITDLAVERDAPFSVNEFRTLNRCLDNAIADAVTEFSARRDTTIGLKQSADENQRRGVLVHELRNHLQTATLAFRALETGRVATGGFTAELLKRSLASMARLLGSSLAEVRVMAHSSGDDASFSLAGFIAEKGGVDTPWHVTAFYPTYKLTDRPRTPAATLRRARLCQAARASTRPATTAQTRPNKRPRAGARLAVATMYA